MMAAGKTITIPGANGTWTYSFDENGKGTRLPDPTPEIPPEVTPESPPLTPVVSENISDNDPGPAPAVSEDTSVTIP